MSNPRVYELAKELGVPSKDLLSKLSAMGVEVKSQSSTVTPDVAAQLRSATKGGGGGSRPATSSSSTKPPTTARSAASTPSSSTRPMPAR